MHEDYGPGGWPYRTLSTGTCYDCGKRFPIHENIIVGCRCTSCQAKFRIEQAKQIHSAKQK